MQSAALISEVISSLMIQKQTGLYGSISLETTAKYLPSLEGSGF